MSAMGSTRRNEPRRRGAGFDNVVQVFVLAAFAWGLLVVLGALTLPIVTVQSSSTSPTVSAPAQPAPSPTPQSSPSSGVHPSPRITILRADGVRGVAAASAPAATSLLAAGLLRLGWSTGRRAILAVAWTLSAVLLMASIVGFVTFLIGLAGIPTGVLLILACARTAPIRRRGRGIAVPTPG